MKTNVMKTTVGLKTLFVLIHKNFPLIFPIDPEYKI